MENSCPVLHRADPFCQLSRAPEREQPAVSFGSSCASPSATAFLRLFRHTAFLLLAAAKVKRLLITVIHFSKSFQRKCSSATFASCDICCRTSVPHSAENGSSYTVFSSAKFRIRSRINSGWWQAHGLMSCLCSDAASVVGSAVMAHCCFCGQTATPVSSWSSLAFACLSGGL